MLLCKRSETKGGGEMNRRGQSTLEYILVVTAILAAVFVASQRIRTTVENQVFEDSASSIRNASSRLPGAR